MSSTPPNVHEKTHAIPDAVSIKVGGQIYTGWEDFKLTRELNSAASDFSIAVTDRWQFDKSDWRLAPDQPIQIYIGKTLVLTGYIGPVKPSFSGQRRSIIISGRSKTGDLVDCSHDGPSRYDNIDIHALALKVCEPFNIPVIFLADPGKVFPYIEVQPGETCFALLDKAIRERKVLMVSAYDGSLVFTNAGTGRATTELRQGVNVKGGSGDYDNSNRFSIYKVKGHGLGFLGTGEQAASVLGTATDAGVTRYRPLIILSDNPLEPNSSQDRANYEMELRAAKALSGTVEVQGFHQQDGSLWEINQLVFADVGYLGIRRQMLIQKVEFNKGNGGTTTTIHLIRPDAFNFHAKKEDPIGWTKYATGEVTTKGAGTAVAQQ